MSLLTLVAIFHVLVAFVLIVFVLLQDPKGGAAGVFGGGGGGQNSFFGASGAGNFLTTLTKWTAIIFAITSVATTYMTSGKSGSVMDDVTVPSAPIEGGMAPAAKPEQPAATETEAPADETPADK